MARKRNFELDEKIKIKEPCLSTRLFFALASGLRQGTIDGAEGVADLGTKQTHNSNHDDGDESENNRVLDEALAFFFRSKQHNNLPFNK
jgi:hypothetical protein